jgi:hypothetical protein
MFIRKRKGKHGDTFTLMRCYRENGKVKQDTLCNLYQYKTVKDALLFNLVSMMQLRGYYKGYSYHNYHWTDTIGGKDYLRYRERCRKLHRYYDGDILALKEKVRGHYHKIRKDSAFLRAILKSDERVRSVNVRKPLVDPAP